MGRKYEIEQLRSEAVGRLTFDFPSTLDEYDQRTLDECRVYSSELDFPFHLFTTINLAREYNMLSILPAVFCRICSMLDIHHMVEAFEASDGTAYALSLLDQRVMIKGRYALTGTLAQRTFRWLTNEDVFTSICITPQKCADKRKAFVVNYWLPTPTLSAMEPWKDWEADWATYFCKPCIAKSKRLHHVGRQQMWNELPSVFGLSVWKDLTSKP